MKWLAARPKDILARQTAAVPDGTRLYAIGDIHGRADLLDKMAGLIDEDWRTRPVRGALTVCLGDYIDRGPDSAQVIERLARSRFPTPLVTLRGNHEDLFERFLRGSLTLEQFCFNGGDATLRSYGLDPHAMLRLTAKEVAAMVRRSVPLLHQAFIGATRLSFWSGDYFFCHAGARPHIPLDQQSDHDLIWIREDFLRSDFEFGKVIVHGHTPVKEPQIRANGIDVDTKAFASGVLTALVLEGAERHFIQARA